jgi:hypothetical protein
MIMRELPNTYAVVCWERDGQEEDAFIRVLEHGRSIAVVTVDGKWEDEVATGGSSPA